ncbi:hypothetical protein TKWG_02420 [Advenella kashmirensis WT001]|uniref:Uncharacterized protein n=1 Tax=Advenella kashmirensis (strain DSM 17095 / LMG 22695 / WT001) TaxID=1036672 RepID=I3U7Y0_ADVKW|nr:hypothetical protein TKWG_02420 [Advenella kashmirensis WT001]
MRQRARQRNKDVGRQNGCFPAKGIALRCQQAQHGQQGGKEKQYPEAMTDARQGPLECAVLRQQRDKRLWRQRSFGAAGDLAAEP